MIEFLEFAFEFSSVLRHCWLSSRKGIWPVKHDTVIPVGSVLESWHSLK